MELTFSGLSAKIEVKESTGKLDISYYKEKISEGE